MSAPALLHAGLLLDVPKELFQIHSEDWEAPGEVGVGGSLSSKTQQLQGGLQGKIL